MKLGLVLLHEVGNNGKDHLKGDEIRKYCHMFVESCEMGM